VALSGRIGKTLNYAGNNLERSAQNLKVELYSRFISFLALLAYAPSEIDQSFLFVSTLLAL
jgi:hypothetical protein